MGGGTVNSELEVGRQLLGADCVPTEQRNRPVPVTRPRIRSTSKLGHQALPGNTANTVVRKLVLFLMPKVRAEMRRRFGSRDLDGNFSASAVLAEERIHRLQQNRLPSSDHM